MRVAALLPLLLLSACKPANPVTPTGTVVFDWELAKAGRASVRTAKIGAKTGKDFKVHVVEKDGVALDLAVHVDFAPIEFEENGSTVSQLAPVAIRGTISRNDGWDVVKSGCDTESGPNYLMGRIGADGKMISPPGMVQDCRVRYHRVGGLFRQSSWQLAVTVNVNGSGKVDVFPPNNGTVEAS